MKTIAITIDDESLKRLGDLEQKKGMNRSQVVREAVRLYVETEERRRDEEQEREVFRRLKSKLGKQAAALMKEQAQL